MDQKNLVRNQQPGLALTVYARENANVAQAAEEEEKILIINVKRAFRQQKLLT